MQASDSLLPTSSSSQLQVLLILIRRDQHFLYLAKVDEIPFPPL